MEAAPTQRFQATVLKQGLNPYVDVPEQVRHAFSGFKHGGRITVEGRLNGVPIRATLIPVGTGGHRLYVNGGMRSAAGVSVGDTVSFELWAISPETVHPPTDVAAALGSIEGAEATFNALSQSHRRELLRYIDDARTPQNRQRSIEKTVAHILGKVSPGTQHRAERPLWTCPKCGNEFVTKNQYHSCATYTLDAAFTKKPPHIVALFERLREMVERCGPVKVLPYRDRVGFTVRVRFAGAVPKTRWLDVGLWLPRRVEHPRFHKIETIYPNAHIHLLRVTDPSQLDEEVAGWIREAYAVGCREHLG